MRSQAQSTGDNNWDCAADSFDATDNTITRNGITTLSDWATGENVPTAVTLARFTASPAGGGNGFVLALMAVGAVGGVLLLRRRQRKHKP